MPEIKDRADELNKRIDQLLSEVFAVRSELRTLQKSVKPLGGLSACKLDMEPKIVGWPDIGETVEEDGFMEAVEEEGFMVAEADAKEELDEHFLPRETIKLRRARRRALMERRLDNLRQQGDARKVMRFEYSTAAPCHSCGRTGLVCKCIQSDRVAKKPPAQSSATFGQLPEEIRIGVAVALDPLVSRELPKTFEELAELIAVLHNVRETLRTFPERPDPRVKPRFG